MKQGEIYEAPSEKYQIEDYVISLNHDVIDDYTQGWNDALSEILKFINKM